MPGFSYGGKGDGTNWSSERGSGPEPGGGSTGNSGNNDRATAPGSQIQAIRNDKTAMAKISNVLKAARKINPNVQATVMRLTPEGIMVVSLEGLNAEQAKQAGLTGLVMGISVPGYVGAVGDIDTGHKFPVKNTEKKYATENGSSLDDFVSRGYLTNTIRTYKDWQSGDERTYYYAAKKAPLRLLHHLTVVTKVNVETYTLYRKDHRVMPIYQVVVTDGNLGGMKITSLGNENAFYSIEWVKKVITDISTVRKQAEGEVLKNTSEIIISVGDKAGAYLGDKYKALSREIASNIQNFQGKRIRSYEQAMASMNKLMANPNMKINAADKTAIINAWKSFNADDMGNKFAALGKTFKLADYALKANNVREKSIEGYNTGNWGPLMREVESWVVSGLTSAVALAVFSATLGAMLVAAGVSATVVGIIGIIIAGLVSAFIDDKFINRLNNEIVRPAY